MFFTAILALTAVSVRFRTKASQISLSSHGLYEEQQCPVYPTDEAQDCAESAMPPPPKAYDCKSRDQEARWALRQLIEKYGQLPHYARSTVIRSLEEFYGPVALKYELRRMERCLMKGKRSPAQAPSEEAVKSYREWVTHQNGFSTVDTVLTHTGDTILYGVSILAPPLAPEAAPVALGLSGAGMAFKAMAYGAEQVATAKANVLFSGQYLPAEIEAKAKAAPIGSERREKILEALKVQATGMSDLSQFSEAHQRKAAERYLDFGIRYSIDIQSDVSRLKVSMDQLNEAQYRLADAQKSLRTGLKGQLNAISVSVQELESKIAQTDLNQRDGMDFLLSLQDQRMSAAEKMVAVERFDYGHYDANEKVRVLDHLQSVKRFEEAEFKFNSLANDVGNVAAILNNVGMPSKELNFAALVGSKASTVLSAIGSFSTNPLGAIASITSIFGGGHEDASAEMHKQLMGAINQVMELQKATIDLQRQTLEKLNKLSSQMAMAFERLAKEIQFAQQLAGIELSISYFDRVIESLASCDYVKNDWNQRYLSGQLAKVDLNIKKANFDELSRNREPFPILSVNDWNRYPVDIGQLENCLTSLVGAKASALGPFRGTVGVIDPKYTTTVKLSNTSPGALVDEIRKRVAQDEKLAKLIQALRMQDPKKFDLILIGLEAPSSKFSNLIRKINFLFGNGLDSAKIAEWRRHSVKKIDSLSNGSLQTIDPVGIVRLVDLWLDFGNIKQLASTENSHEFVPHYHSLLSNVYGPMNKEELEAEIALVDSTIIQQSSLNGDMLLESLDNYFDYGKADTANSGDNSIVEADFKKLDDAIAVRVYDLIRVSPELRHNLIRFRLAKAINPTGRSISYGLTYSIGYQMLNKTGEPAWINSLVEPYGLHVARNPSQNHSEEHPWVLELQGKTGAEISASRYSINLPKPEEVGRDDINSNGLIAMLLQRKSALTYERYKNRMEQNASVHQRIELIEREIANEFY